MANNEQQGGLTFLQGAGLLVILGATLFWIYAAFSLAWTKTMYGSYHEDALDTFWGLLPLVAAEAVLVWWLFF